MGLRLPEGFETDAWTASNGVESRAPASVNTIVTCLQFTFNYIDVRWVVGLAYWLLPPTSQGPRSMRKLLGFLCHRFLRVPILQNLRHQLGFEVNILKTFDILNEAKFQKQWLVTWYGYSEQQLVDCDTYDGGCQGGWYYNAWTYLQSHGSNSGYEYGYTGAVSNPNDYYHTLATQSNVPQKWW